MTDQSTTSQAYLKYLLKILLSKLRYELLITPCIREKIIICNSIQDCAVSLGQINEFNCNELLDLTAPVHPTLDCGVKVIADSSTQGRIVFTRVLALIEGLSTNLRTVNPHLCAIIRRAIESSAKALHIDQITPEHIEVSHNASYFFLLYEKLVCPEIPSRPARDTQVSNTFCGTQNSSRELLPSIHEQIYGIEIPAAEVCAAIPLRFPNLPEELDLTLARQTYEEGRHARMLLDAFSSRGGDASHYSPSFRIWDNMLCGRSLIESLCIEHVLGEGYALGYDLQCIDDYRKQGISDLADIHVSLYADEIMHVTDGIKWFNRLAGDASNDTIARLELDFAVTPPADPWFRADLRRLVGFTESQILRQQKLIGSEKNYLM